MRITALEDRALAERYLTTSWEAVKYIVDNYLNPFHFRNHRIHHYHMGILIILVGIILTTLKMGTETILLNGKETNPMEISQGLGLWTNLTFYVFDMPRTGIKDTQVHRYN